MANKQNITRLIERLERVQKKEPDNYDQGMWFCGTAACIGGHACLMDGWEKASRSFVRKGRIEALTFTAAQEILGLSDGEAAKLFNWAADCWSDKNRKLLQSTNPRKRVQGAIQELRRYL